MLSIILSQYSSSSSNPTKCRLVESSSVLFSTIIFLWRYSFVLWRCCRNILRFTRSVLYISMCIRIPLISPLSIRFSLYTFCHFYIIRFVSLYKLIIIFSCDKMGHSSMEMSHNTVGNEFYISANCLNI